VRPDESSIAELDTRTRRIVRYVRTCATFRNRRDTTTIRGLCISLIGRRRIYRSSRIFIGQTIAISAPRGIADTLRAYRSTLSRKVSNDVDFHDCARLYVHTHSHRPKIPHVADAGERSCTRMRALAASIERMLYYWRGMARRSVLRTWTRRYLGTI